MEARNRKLTDWFAYVQRGEIKLPRFQRYEAWDTKRIRSLLDVMVSNLPLGITLILEVGDDEKFISRYLMGRGVIQTWGREKMLCYAHAEQNSCPACSKIESRMGQTSQI